jgi:protein-L-isoaspartate(D-aspartate) O-methyltransferase
MNFEHARFNMVEQQIRPWEVIAPELVAALFRIKREQFVAPALRHLSLADTELDLGQGEKMLLPGLEARLINALRLMPNDKVLEVGTGSGYMAAVLGVLASQVSSVERRPDLVAAARGALRATGMSNVTVHEGDGLAGLPGDAPFDAIVLSGSVREVPKVLLEQLKTGGRLVAIVGVAPVMKVQRITRIAAAEWATQNLFETSAPGLHETTGARFEF